jgi:hypothetical protein
MDLTPLRTGLAIGILLCGCAPAHAAQTLWLSDAAPNARGKRAQGHGGPVTVRKGTYFKRLWLREGDLPQDADYVAQSDEAPSLVLIDTAGKIETLPFSQAPDNGPLSVEFPMPEEGFYNAYVERRRVNDGVLEVSLAKAEVMKHSCREGHDNVQVKMPPRHHAAMPLEVVRERKPKEDFHSRLGHGDEVGFRVLRNGAPLAGAQVTLTSGQGWSKRLLSDGEGNVSFRMIRDYYPPWSLFKKRHAQPYLLNVRYSQPAAGELDGEAYHGTRYTASFTGSYYPSPDDYQSYAYGLSFGLFALLSTGGGVYFFRRRRKRPYREVRFDE